MTDTLLTAEGACPLGAVLLASGPAGLAALLIGDDLEALREDLRRRLPEAELRPGGPALDDTLAAVLRALEDPSAPVDLPLAPRGSDLQRQVWAALRDIPAGRTTTYSALAAAVGRPDAVRAVASACGANPIAVLIPCHRVLARDGGLAGYRWGVERKRQLLRREGALLTLF